MHHLFSLEMAPLLFEYFYELDCVSEEAFNAWLKNPNKSENEGKLPELIEVTHLHCCCSLGHSVVEMSTKDFFTWLEQAEEEEES